ncbi:MAG: endonuclease/exonuclease/phosphatase family protein [Brachymonas sp.]
MKLVSLNTWKAEGQYLRRIEAMAQGLKALSPDVIALQEDLRTADELTHTARSLALALDMQVFWLPARPKLRTVGMQRKLTTSGMAILSRYPVQEQHVLALPQDERDGERVAQCVRLADPAGDWWLVNLHLTHLDDRADLRKQQLETILSAMADLAPTQPVVLCGDFNAGPDDEEISHFLSIGRLRDVFSDAAKVTHVDAAGVDRNLDHILLRPNRGLAVAIGYAAVVLDKPNSEGVMFSDHYGVYADLRFSEAAPH